MMEKTSVFCADYPVSFIRESEKHKTLVNTFNNNKKPDFERFFVIGTDGHQIEYGNGPESIDSFFNEYTGTEILLVSSVKEWELLLVYSSQYSIKINVIERDFPIFDDIRFSKRAEINYRQTQAKLKLLRKYGVKRSSLSKSLLPEYKKRFFNKIRTKTILDQYFGLASLRPVREVFMLSEERADRTIIALDVNSMYLNCMGDKFGSPRSLKRVNDVSQVTPDNPVQGLYRVKLSEPKTSFIRKFHPFQFSKSLENFPFIFEDNMVVETFLSASEYTYYAKHFDSSEVVEAFIFEEEIQHPMKSLGLRIFKRKQSVPKGPRKNLLKASLSYMHTVSSAKDYETVRFEDAKSAAKSIAKTFTLPKHYSSVEGISKLLNYPSARYKVINTEDGVKVGYRNLCSPKVVNSFNFEIISRARVHMLSLLERFLAFDGLEVCYINVDSFHVSIPTDKKKEFYEKFSGDISDNELGKLKIECEASSGYWLELGQYYLVHNNKIVKHRTGPTKPPGSSSPVVFSRIVKGIKKQGGFNFIVQRKLKNEYTLSYKKKAFVQSDHIKQERFNMRDINGTKNESFATNILSLKPMKLDLLKKIKDLSEINC